ncbi:hypothetical protein [Hydrogenovibrio marinus]|uniref:Uncharacterized protein n=1 Tax=Hydrogenovibrio marinus TaxID=28885 RepID=A0A066ZTP5_HYDMR|nr:hypothetical protein [Hydrogenovibrio marinus]KDN96877.1 hypothetical protein EI16_11625 [Hydrogenovibrio marinus]BBN59136.1 hypothetical protein HVMH_0730 [Hydrogenovibrio marinus]
MPYKVTSLQDGYCYTAVVPRRLLAHTIIKYLVKKDLRLADFTHIVQESHLNPLMIVDEAQFNELLESNPGVDLIYNTIRLKDNSLIHYHTNWTVPQNNWQLMTEQLNAHDIHVETIPTKDLPSSIKTKTKLED